MKNIFLFLCFLTVGSQFSCHLEKLTPDGAGDADFSVDLTDNDGYAPCKAQFENLSSNGISFVWDFGDGSAPSAAPNPIYKYLKPGDYFVTLTVTDASGIETSVTKPVTIKTRTFARLIDDFNSYEVKDVLETKKGNFWVVGDVDSQAYLMKTDIMGNKTDVSFYDPVSTGTTVLEVLDDISTFFGERQGTDFSGPFIYALDPPDLFITQYITEAKTMVDAVKTTDGSYVFICNNLGQIYISKRGTFPFVSWSGYVGSGGTVNGNDLIQTSDGGFAISGTFADMSTGQLYLYLVKLNSSGNIQWVYNSYVLDGLVSWDVAQTTDGQFVVCGGSKILRIGSSGNKIWEKNFAGEGQFVGIAPTLDNGIVTVGTNNNAVAMLKVNELGIKTWSRAYESGWFNNEGRAIRATSDCGFIVLGAASQDFGYAPYLIKTDAAGLLE